MKGLNIFGGGLNEISYMFLICNLLHMKSSLFSAAQMTEPGRNRFYCTVSLHGLKWKDSVLGLWDLCVGGLQVVPAHAKWPPDYYAKGIGMWPLSCYHDHRRKIRLIEGNAKCRNRKKLTCQGRTLWQVFICLRPGSSYPPPLHTVYVYTVYLFTRGGGGRELNQREG
jgi:hypothetical protein